MKKIIIIVFFATQLLFAQSILINEVMSSNSSTILDAEGDASDWIELYNNSLIELNLDGYYLSDDTLNTTKWQFKNIIIQPEEYMVIFASGKDTIINNSHTNFKLSANGERLILSDSAGSIIDQINISSSLTDVSFGRISDAADTWIFQEPTPGSTNTGIPIQELADEIIVSLSSGFYPSTISIELTAGDSKIYFTLDGSDPNSNSTEYNEPVSINNTTVLKAISIKDGYLNTPIIHQTYFINENTKLPVISLSTNPDNFFDSDSGIYVNFEEDWERPAHIEFFDDDKDLGFSENVGINIYGGYTRRFVQKSLAVKFKSKYGKNKLEYDLFPGFRLKKFKSFIMRNSGNDFDQTHIRDAFMQTLIKDQDIDYLEYRPAVTYINGEYWGIYNIREKINEHYVANRHGVDPDNIDMMGGYSAYNDDENDPDGEYGLWVGNLEVLHGDTINYTQLIDYLNTEDLSTDEAYNFIDSMIDIDECLLYYAAQVYYNSQDWPANNSKYWRERTPEGKWRWILYDLDFGFNLYEYNNEGNKEDHVNYLFSGDPSQRPWSKPVESTFIPRKIVENPRIKKQFVNRVADLLNSNFKTNRVLTIMNSIADHIADDIGRHRARFNKNGNDLSRLISFANERPDYLRDHVRNFFGSGSDCLIKIKSGVGGEIEINSLTLKPEDFPWSGIYFQDNSVNVKAIPTSGYIFDGWDGTITSGETSLEISGIRTVSLTASFSIDSSATNDIVINEINYNSNDIFDSGDWVEIYNKSGNDVDLSDWYFTDSDTSHKFLLPEGRILKADSFVVMVQKDSLFKLQFPDVTNYIGNMEFGLSGSGEYIGLYNSNGEIVDSLTYDNKSPWPIVADGMGSTLELANVYMDNSLGESWIASVGYGSPAKINTVVTSVEKIEEKIIPTDYFLSQNYPNPFNPETRISYQLPKAGHVSLIVYDMLGREVKVLIDTEQNAGSYELHFDASKLSSGLYFYRITALGFNKTLKMILLK